jgi:hypothetical protein
MEIQTIFIIIIMLAILIGVVLLVIANLYPSTIEMITLNSTKCPMCNQLV